VRADTRRLRFGSRCLPDAMAGRRTASLADARTR
jgi:hypothetical protein